MWVMKNLGDEISTHIDDIFVSDEACGLTEEDYQNHHPSGSWLNLVANTRHFFHDSFDEARFTRIGVYISKTTQTNERELIEILTMFKEYLKNMHKAKGESDGRKNMHTS